MSRDQDKEGILPTPDSTPWIVVSPPSKRERKGEGNTFLSLNETTKKYHTIPLSPPRKAITMTPRLVKVKDEPSVEKKIPPEPGEPTLQNTLATMVSDINISNPKNPPHEILKGLSRQGITTWDGFILMAEDDIPKLNKAPDAPLSPASIRMLDN